MLKVYVFVFFVFFIQWTHSQQQSTPVTTSINSIPSTQTTAKQSTATDPALSERTESTKVNKPSPTGIVSRQDEIQANPIQETNNDGAPGSPRVAGTNKQVPVKKLTLPLKDGQGPVAFDIKEAYPNVQKPQCPKTCVRKDIDSFTDEELNAYVNAFKKMSTLILEDTKLSLLAKLAQIHNDYESFSHRRLELFLWHRYFLSITETLLQHIDPNVCLGYWEPKALPSGQPFYSEPVFQRVFGTATGNLGRLGPVVDGPFRNFKPRGNEEVLMRQYTNATLSSPEYILGLMQSSKTFADFSQLYSALPHGAPHEFIGGSMATMQSPLDPVFMFHHTNLDRVFEGYLQLYPEQEYPAPKVKLVPFDILAGSILDTTVLCFSYDRLLPLNNAVPNNSPQPGNVPPPPPPSPVSDATAKKFVQEFSEAKKKEFDVVFNKVNEMVKTQKVIRPRLVGRSRFLSAAMTNKLALQHSLWMTLMGFFFIFILF
ncbi:hypothetical protein HMI56_003127 [Coelomomyces lativittatus]|nr:hypothetical protein HMI56_003127 [Coelomomyces lativittatus]